MTAGTVVITGGILATVILLCVIAVLCYCRLQYYCCKGNGSEEGSAGDLQPQFACNACSAPGMDGAAVTPLVLPYEPTPPHSYCPTCTPYYLRNDVRNGGERLAFMPSLYENTHMSTLNLAALHGHMAPCSPRDLQTNIGAISTDV